MLSDDRRFYLFFILITILYCLGVGTNAIWTTHEAYYATAVREILESGNWLDISFNYEPRLQKPPLTYWLMAISASFFGLSEIALRIPIVICSLATVLLVYQIGQQLYHKQVAFVAMLVFSMSLQFVWFKHYASPEIPLTFFFTLGIYCYLRGVNRVNNLWLYLSFVSIGLAMLVKGFPYLLIFLAIVGFHKITAKDPVPSYQQILIGTGIACILGFSWSVYMIIQNGNAYLEMLQSETIGRFSSHGSIQNIFLQILYYPETILWSMFPFSLLFYYCLIKGISRRSWAGKLRFPLIWFSVFLVGFTFSSGKLPVYIMQAQPAMALIIGFMIFETGKGNRWEWLIYRITLWLPGLLIAISFYFLVIELNLSKFYLLLPMVAIGILLASKNTPQKAMPAVSLWLICTSLMAVIFLGLFPWVEQYRPYRDIQTILEKEVQNKDEPLYIEERFLDNLSYYARRKVFGGPEWKLSKIYEQTGEKLVLLKMERGSFDKPVMIENSEILWEGLIHAKGAEDHFFKFISDCYRLSKGDSTKFIKYQLIRSPEN